MLNKKELSDLLQNFTTEEILQQTGMSQSTSGRPKEMATSLEGQIHHSQKQTGQLNPDWVEHLMGLPPGWTDCGSWGME